MAKKRAKKKDGGAAAMEVSATITSPPRPSSPDDAMDMTDVVPTGSELDLLVSKKKRKKKASASVSKSLQIQGITKKGPQKRRAAKLRKEKSIERALLNMDKQHEKVQRSEFKTERVQSLKNLY
ncbi:hypothetical protein CY35_10G011800 [Sphagnum magellanicum]|nr:hypothetical protein CY35_10G011800 [Sphagnum magellanicum]